MPHSRRAFTLVEMLVVIAIISLLIALLLPAIQAARESGRRTVCGSNLAQLVKAVHTHQETRNHMPAYYRVDEYILSKSSWYVFMLPYMDSYSLYWEMQGKDGETTQTVVTSPATPAGPDCIPAKPGIWVATERQRNVPGTGAVKPATSRSPVRVSDGRNNKRSPPRRRRNGSNSIRRWNIPTG